MATGKTTVGRLVARSLARDFLDLDLRVEELAGMTVGEIFRSKGEAAFRAFEAQALEQALETRNVVIATGGGAACRQPNLERMLARGFVVALSAPPAEVMRRTGRVSGRPLLDGAANPLAAAAKLLEEREPFYAQAHERIDTVGRTTDEVAAMVLAALRKEGMA
jgi:shikimate kinase